MSVYASVLFGSKVRNNTDIFSDNDLLIVCSDEERTNSILSQLYENYNITYFSKNQLDRMKSKGSLFLQHIKKDGIVLFDKNNYLKRFLLDLDFIEPSKNEINRCESTISFINAIPNNELLSFWKADFTYCVSRDYLIKKLAEKKLLAFGIDEIEGMAIENFGFSFKEMSLLKELRVYKALNRDCKLNYKSIDNNRLNFCINEWLFILMTRMSINHECIHNNLLDCLFNRKYVSTYESLRCLEGIYTLVEDKKINHIEHNVILNYIKLPNLYRSLQIKKWDSIKKYINDMRCFLY